MLFVKNEDCKTETLASGTERVIKGYINDMMVVELTWKKGQVGALHSHPHRQCGYVISGLFEAVVNGEPRVLGPGECFYTEANEEHGLTCLEDGVSLDVFTPYREDFVK